MQSPRAGAALQPLPFPSPFPFPVPFPYLDLFEIPREAPGRVVCILRWMSEDRPFTTSASELLAYSGEVWRPVPILHTAEHAVAVYLDTDGYIRACRDAGFDGGTVIKRGSAAAGMAWSDELIVISPVGSNDSGDWIGNLMSWLMRPWPGVLPGACRVGYGFLRQAKLLCPEILQWIRTLEVAGRSYRIVVDGHSLGAALVPLIVSYLSAEGVRVDVAVSHESPRVGNVEFAEWYDARFKDGHTSTWSIVNVVAGHPDIVTRLPKKDWGFRHLGKRVILDGGKTLHGDERWQEYRSRNPIGNGVAAWRIFTRFYRRAASSIRAHYGRSLLASLRARASRRVS